MFKINCLCCPRKQTRLESKLIHTSDTIQFNSAPRPISLWAELNWIVSLVRINLLSNSFASSHNTGNFYKNYKPRATGSLPHLMLKVFCAVLKTAPYRLNYFKLIHRKDTIQFNSAQRPIGQGAELNWIVSEVWINLLSRRVCYRGQQRQFILNIMNKMQITFLMIKNFIEIARVVRGSNQVWK